MIRVYTEDQIEEMLKDRKVITQAEFLKLLRPRKPRVGPQRRAQVEVVGQSGQQYVVAVQRNVADPLNFSVRLAIPHGGNKQLNLIRCSGLHGAHSNDLERTKIPPKTCHIHRMTHRYLKLWAETDRFEPERFAEETFGYQDFTGAVRYLCRNFSVYVKDAPDRRQRSLFD